MPRQRSPNRDKAFEIYKEHKGNIKLKDIAQRLNVSDVQVRYWKSKDKWDNKINNNVIKSKNNVINKKTIKNNSSREPIADEVKEVLENTKLTDKQRHFCFYYSRCLNATKAYQKAYECSYIEAARHSYELRKNEDVNKLIDMYIDQEINKERLKKSLVQKYIDIAFSDIKDYMEFGQKELPMINPKTGEEITNKEGKPLTYTLDYAHFKNSSEVDGTLISEVSKGKDGAKIKLQDKMKAMDWLGNHIDLLTTEQQGKLKIEKEKLKITAVKVQGDPEETTEDDGFIEALEGTAQEDWSDEEN